MKKIIGILIILITGIFLFGCDEVAKSQTAEKPTLLGCWHNESGPYEGQDYIFLDNNQLIIFSSANKSNKIFGVMSNYRINNGNLEIYQSLTTTPTASYQATITGNTLFLDSKGVDLDLIKKRICANYTKYSTDRYKNSFLIGNWLGMEDEIIFYPNGTGTIRTVKNNPLDIVFPMLFEIDNNMLQIKIGPITRDYQMKYVSEDAIVLKSTEVEVCPFCKLDPYTKIN